MTAVGPAEATGPPSQPVELVAKVNLRLFSALFVLIALTLATLLASTLLAEIGWVVPVLVVLCGALGGFISIQRRVKALSGDDLTLLCESWLHIGLAPLVGGILALLLYIVFVSGLLSGDLFPEFQSDCVKERAGCTVPRSIKALFQQHASEGHAGYAKLIFWSFVAGYSEHFVTDIVGQFRQVPGTPTADD